MRVKDHARLPFRRDDEGVILVVAALVLVVLLGFAAFAVDLATSIECP